MLDRIAVQQTRIRVPGLGLDHKGVALGQRGVVLFASIERLVSFLSIYTRERSLADLMGGLELYTVRSKLGHSEILLSFLAESSDRMDRMAETARLAGGYTFTGTSRHFVQYRDAFAPFGYDTSNLLPADADWVLYHNHFTQAYGTEKSIDLKSLLLRLEPRVDPSTYETAGPLLIVAEPGVGGALIHYLVRSKVDAEVCVGEWPPESAFDEGPIRRTIFRIPDLPKRMRKLFFSTPGMSCFFPSTAFASVEAGFRHPVELRACPSFNEGHVFFRGKRDPLVLAKMPAMGKVDAFSRVSFRDGTMEATALPKADPEVVRVPLRLAPSGKPWRSVTATWIAPGDYDSLRKLAYALPPRVIRETQIAVTASGLVLRSTAGIEAIPLGTFYIEIHPSLFIPAGYEVVPSVSPEVLFRAIGAPRDIHVFVAHDSTAVGIEEAHFSPLETFLVEAKPLSQLSSEGLERTLSVEPIDLSFESVEVPLLHEADAAEELP